MRPSVRNGLLHGQGAYVFNTAEAQAYWAVLTTKPNYYECSIIDVMYRKLKAGPVSGSNLLTKLDVLYDFESFSAEAAAINIINPATFTADLNDMVWRRGKGIAGDGVDDFADSGWNPSTAPSPLYTLNSACIFADIRTATASDTPYFGISDGAATTSFVTPRRTDTLVGGRINMASTANFSGAAPANGIGSFALDRSASNALNALVSGVQQGSTSTIVSSAVTNGTLRFGGLVTVNTHEYYSGGAGGHLTDNEHLDRHTIMRDVRLARLNA